MGKKFLELIMNLKDNQREPVVIIKPWKKERKKHNFEFMTHLHDEISFFCFEDTEIHISLFKGVPSKNKTPVILKMRSFNNDTGETKTIGEMEI